MKKFFVVFVCCILLVGCSFKDKSDRVENNIDKSEIDENVKKVPNDYDDAGIFKDYYIQVYEKLQTMSLEEKVGQMIFARLPQNNVIKDIENYRVGGFILFGVDFKNKQKEQIINEIKSYQDASTIPLLLGVDEEGGTVIRISSNLNLYDNRFLSPQEVYQKSGMEGIINDTKEKALLLKELGLNVNLAPVSDVSINSNDFIYSRSFGKNAKETSEYVRNVVKTYLEYNVGCTLKHFPGYGNNVDTHTGIAIDVRDYQTFVENDFLPFKAGIEEDVPSILVSHNIVNSMDSEKPASLSKKVHEILRNDLGFTGVIMTDDLAMDAITLYTDNPYIEAVLAGNDLLITTDYKDTYNSILNGVKDGKIDEEMINKATFRILAWKYQLGLFEED